MVTTALELYDPTRGFQPYVKPERFSGLRGGLEALKDSVKRALHAKKYRPEKKRAPKMLVLIPAHNEEDSIAETLTSILSQSRKADRIVVIADNCTDNTIAIANRFKSVTVMETVNNSDRKVGALTQGWRRWGAGFEYVAGVDADTVLHPDCFKALEDEMEKDQEIGGIMARFTFDQNKADGPVANILTRMQRMEFTQWVGDIGHRKCQAHVLGGQASLFRGRALSDVAVSTKRNSPWSTRTMVEDAELSLQLHASKYRTVLSRNARAYPGAMHTIRSLWGQRMKWQEGNVRLCLENGYNGPTKVHWRQQIAHLLDLTNRTLFLVVLAAAVSAGMFEWRWYWAIPPVLSIFVNFRSAWRSPHRKPMDIIASLTMIQAEFYLWFTLAVATVGWVNVLSGSTRDGWANQYRAEAGKSAGVGRMFAWLVAIGGVGYGIWYGWMLLALDTQATIINIGWIAVMVLTVMSCIRMLYKLFRPSRGFRP